jgi:hypothetical protein
VVPNAFQYGNTHRLTHRVSDPWTSYRGIQQNTYNWKQTKISLMLSRWRDTTALGPKSHSMKAQTWNILSLGKKRWRRVVSFNFRPSSPSGKWPLVLCVIGSVGLRIFLNVQINRKIPNVCCRELQLLHI